MPRLPTGTVTFLFTDIEASTRLLQHLSEAASEKVFADHQRLLRDTVEATGGFVYQDQGESFLFVFQRARDAVLAAVAAQRALVADPWPEGAPLRVRMALHSGEPSATPDGYVGVDVHRVARICQAGHGGQILLSDATRSLVEDGLPKEISLRDMGEHLLKDLARPARLFQIMAVDLPADFPVLKSLSILPNNLPRQLTNFIGRERETAEVKRLLASTRLLTLTGAGGVGKTRLALQVAAEVLDQFTDGVWLVELASLPDPGLLPQTIASALGIREQPGRPILATVMDFLQLKALLLLLDNVEHLVAACAELTEAMLRACSHLRILATSREPLGIPAETAWRVPSLSLPDATRRYSTDDLRDYEAIRLFAERVAAVQPSFVVTAHSAETIAQICRQLDGIPLAIELAAARVRVLSLDQIVARLHDRFQLLTGGGRTVLPRHQTLRGAMDWSHDLLSEAERVPFRRLSVFAGGLSLEAAEKVCAGDTIDQHEILDLLAKLADKSLVVVERPDRGEARYRLLETVRQYAAEKLAASGETATVGGRHLTWFLELAEHAEEGLRGPDQENWLQRLGVDLDNLRGALGWCLAGDGPAGAGLRLAGALGLFWDARGYLSEGRRWLEHFLSATSGLADRARARALNWAGVLAYRQGDYERVQTLCQEALALSRTLGDEWNHAQALHYLGHVAQVRGEFDDASSLMQKSIDLFRGMGDRWGLSMSLNCSGDIARSQGAYDRARTLLEEAVTFHREIRNRWGMALSLHNLGYVALRQDPGRADRLFKDSLETFRAIGANPLMATCVAGLAAAAGAEGNLKRAAALFGASEALLADAGIQLEPADRADYDRALSGVRAALPEADFASAWTEGQAMSLEQAVEFALS